MARRAFCHGHHLARYSTRTPGYATNTAWFAAPGQLWVMYETSTSAPRVGRGSQSTGAISLSARSPARTARTRAPTVAWRPGTTATEGNRVGEGPTTQRH